MIKAALKTYCFVLLAALISCRDNNALKEAEALLETNPAAADSILTSMPVPTSNRDRAWHAVLKTQADYKLYKPITSDSLILTATNYYGIHRINFRSALAWYTQGCVYHELKDDLSAINSYLKAIDLFPDTLLRYYALTEQYLGICYLSKGMYDDANTYFIRCRENANRLSDSTMIAFSDYNKALIQLYNKCDDGINETFKQLHKSKYLSKYYRNESLVQLAKYHIFTTVCLDSALYYLDLKAKESNKIRGASNNLRGEIYYLQNNMDSAYYYYKLSLVTSDDIYTDCASYKRLCELSHLFGNTDDAFNYGKLYTESVDSIRILRNANDIAAISIAHKSEIEAIKRKEFKNKTIISSALLLLAALVLLYASYQSRFKTIYSNYIKFCDNVWTRINTTLSTDSTDSDYLSFCKTKYLNSPSHFILMSPLHEKYNREEKDAIKHDINVAFSDLMAYMLNKYPSINNKEVQLCILNSLGTEKSKICQILDLSDDSFRKQKSRLKEKLGDSYILYFG